MNEQYVVVRSNESGVWLGKLATMDKVTRTVVLKDAIKAHYWEGALATSGLAVNGPTGGRLTSAVAEVTIFTVIEIISATPEAVAAWKAVKPWSR